MRRVTTALCPLVLFALLAVIPSIASAGMTVVPFMGRMTPTNAMTVDHTTPIIIQLGDLAVFGTRLDWTTGSRLTPELSVGYGRGDMDLIGNSEINFSTAVLQADARARIALCRTDATAAFSLVLGAGMAHMQSALIDFFKDQNAGIGLKNRVAGIVGLGASARLNDNIHVRVDFEDHIHSTEFDSDTFPHKNTEHDLVMTVGIPLALGSH